MARRRFVENAVCKAFSDTLCTLPNDMHLTLSRTTYSLLLASTVALSIPACSNESGQALIPGTGVDAGSDGASLSDVGASDGGASDGGADDTVTPDSSASDVAAGDANPADSNTDTAPMPDATNDSGEADTAVPDVGLECESPDPSSDCTQCACVSGEWECSNANEGMACDGGLVCADAMCLEGVCTEMGPLDCQDGFSCTIDTCSEDGGCSNEVAPDACIISGACVAEGDTASRACGICDPSTSSTEWTPFEGCSYSVDLPIGSGSFGVSNDGRVTVAGWQSGALTAQCLNDFGQSEASVELFAADENRSTSGGYAYVSRAAETGQSVIVATLPQTNGDDRYTTMMAWWLDAECTLVTGPTLLPGMDGTETTGSIEYADLVMGDLGQTAVVYQSRLEGSYNPTLALFDGVGAPVGSAQSLSLAECSNRTYGVHIAMNETTGDVVASCQGHASDPIMVRRYDASGAADDEGAFDATGENNSSWYDSHALGMSDDGSFVLVFAESSATSLRGAFYDPTGAHITTVTLAEGTGQWHDGYRRVHAHISILPDGSYVIPGAKSNESTRFFAVYNTTGELVVEVPLTADPPSLRVDGNGALYAMERSGSITRGLGAYALDVSTDSEE